MDKQQILNLRRVGNPVLVYNRDIFEQMLHHLSEQPRLALDTESDSLFSYHPKICLIQITTYTHPDGDPTQVTDYLVDPLRFSRLDGLAALLREKEVEVVMHAAENDILVLQREYDFTFRRIFDTQLAARILGWRRVGLAAILEEHFGVVSNKRMQRTNWGKRPLTPEQIAYAQMDTHYLLALRELLASRLQASDRWEEAQEAFQQLTQLDFRDRNTPERTFWQTREARQLPREATGIFQALWEWREREAQQQDRPPFKVLQNQALARLATEQPTTLTGLRACGLSQHQVRRYGQTLLALIQQARSRPLPPLPLSTPRPEESLDAQILARFDALRQWRSHVAAKRGVDPDIVFPNTVLLEIARHAPSTLEELAEVEGVGPWKLQTYGPTILQLLGN